MSHSPMPLVSVLIPCYNGERYLREAIDSCLAQTYPNVEIIVVNDGSKDGSDEICRSYGDQIVYVNQENRGLSGARNAAIEHAQGEFVILCDADDVLLPECIALRVQPLIDSPKVGLVVGYYREIDADSQLSPRVPELRTLGPEDHYWQELKRNFGPPLGWTIRKSAFLKSGVFDPMLPHCEDWDLALRILRHYDMAYVPEVAVHYRQHAGGQSKRFLQYFDGVRQIQKKNSCYTKQPLKYWWNAQAGKFEAGRRILFSIITEGAPAQRLGKLVHYCVRRPDLVWIGFFSAITFIGGKRATSKAPESA